MQGDVHLKKTIPFVFRGHALRFRVSQRLFSSHRVDRGSELLLRSLEPPAGAAGTLLDVGCGYGVLGLSLLSAGYAAAAHLVDRDALALEYARQNAELNGIAEASVYGSLGLSAAPPLPFALVVSNVPAKAGEEPIAALLRDAALRLAPDGRAAIVIVAPLAGLAREVVAGLPGASVLYEREHAEHTVLHYRCEAGAGDSHPAPADAEAPYLRGETEARAGSHAWRLETARGLPDFEQPGHGTRLLLDAIAGLEARGERGATVFEPGVGHVPVLLWRALRPRRLRLVSRDLLALRFSLRNLRRSGCPETCVSLSHQVAWRTGTDAGSCVAATLRGDETNAEAAERAAQLAAALDPAGVALVVGTSTSVARLEAAIRRGDVLRVRGRRKRRGFCVLTLTRRA